MAAPVRLVACALTLFAMLSPSAVAAWTVVHLAVDAHHHEGAPASDDHRHDAAAVLHGHPHDGGAPAHRHDTTAAAASQQLPTFTSPSHPTLAGAISPPWTAGVSAIGRFGPSPPSRVPIILRI